MNLLKRLFTSDDTYRETLKKMNKQMIDPILEKYYNYSKPYLRDGTDKQLF